LASIVASPFLRCTMHARQEGKEKGKWEVEWWSLEPFIGSVCLCVYVCTATVK